MILNFFFFFSNLFVSPGLAEGSDGQTQAIKSIECSKNNQTLHWVFDS